MVGPGDVALNKRKVTVVNQMLVISELHKRYASKHVLNGISISLDAGHYALVGGNGAGKSTLLKVLSGAEDADAGKIVIDGTDLKARHIEAKRKFAYVPDKPLVYPFLKGSEFLKMVSSMRHINDKKSIDSLVQLFGLAPHYEKKFKEMSLGTQRKFFLVAAFIANPKVLIMDEPTNGLDQNTMDNLVDLIKHKNAPQLVLFSTHDQTFIQRLSAAKLLLKDGQLSLA